jgi:hypothetical protein
MNFDLDIGLATKLWTKLTWKDSALLRSRATMCSYTRDRFAGNNDEDNKCPWCNNTDGVLHRLYECEALSIPRARHLSHIPAIQSLHVFTQKFGVPLKTH